jgi:hypothetical protein
MREIRDMEERALALAVQVAELLDAMDQLAPSGTRIVAGRIVGPGVEVRRTANGFTARSA